MAVPSENEFQIQVQAFTPADWAPLLALRSRIDEATEFKTVSANGKFFEWTDVVSDFHTIVYDMPIVVNFDWKSWDLGVSALGDGAHDFRQHDLLTLCKLVTTIVRAERFNEGFMPKRFADGSVSKILDAIAQHVDSF